MSAALERLKRLELVDELENGELKRIHSRLNTTDDIFNSSIQKAHVEDMELARESLLNDPVEVRDFTSLTIPVSPKLLPMTKFY